MKAIVLTCDRYAPFARHMILCYQRAWADHPFTFRLPYQDTRPGAGLPTGTRFEEVHTDRPIRDTVLTLVEDLPDDEWVYWCIDDKYPIELDGRGVRATVDWLGTIDDPRIAGVSFARARRLTLAKHLRPDAWLRAPDGERFIRRRSYRQFWLHQFYRVKVLRHLFQTLPGGQFAPHTLDDIVMFQRRLPPDHRLYVREHNAAVFGESTEKGVITGNCAESFRSLGLDLPAGFELGTADTTIGTIGQAGEHPRSIAGFPKWALAVAKRRM